MLTISCQQMKAMDSYAINNIGIPSIVLMENAALKVVENIDLEKFNSFTIVCGVGNNGGDGLAVARHLILNGETVHLFIIGNLEKGTKNFNVNLNILKNLDVEFVNISKDEDLDLLRESLDKNHMTIDSIFGIGLARDVGGLFYDVINIMNEFSKNILSIDVPSGLNADTGKPMGISIKADKTIIFHHMKKGLLDSEDYTGEVIVEDIGIPNKATVEILGAKYV